MRDLDNAKVVEVTAPRSSRYWIRTLHPSCGVTLAALIAEIKVDSHAMAVGRL
jgi:hypothetical protein